MFKRDLKRAEKSEIKLPTSTGSLKKQESSRKKDIYFCFIDYAKSFDCVDHNKLYDTLWPNGPQNARISCHAERHGFWKRWKYQTTWPASWETCMQVRKQQLNWIWNNRLVPNRKRSLSRLYIVTLLINLYVEYIMRNAGLEEAHAGIKVAGRNINNLRYADDTTWWQKVKRN